MKILHIVESFGGGVLTSVSQLCNLQVNNGYQVILAHSLRPETPLDYKGGLDARVQTMIINLARKIDPTKDFLGLLQVRKIIREVDPEIIHLHSSKAGFIGRLAVMLGNKKDIRVFYSPRGFSFLQSNLTSSKRYLYYLLEKIAASFGGTIVACSQGEAKEAARLKKNGKVVLVENAVDVDTIPLKQFADDNVLKIGTLGRLCPQKNPFMFKQLANEFLNRPQVKFIWIGGGDDSYRLNELSNILQTSWLPRKEALKFLSQLDIYVQTSLWEGMPISVIEAMVSGIPTIVTDVVGNADVVIHGQTGFVASSYDELVSYVNMLINDREMRLKMGEQARAVAMERFSLSRLNEDINKLISHVNDGH